MPERCTCGAQLPPDARFCHKCGKPQYDYPGTEPEPAIEQAPVPVVAPAAPEPIGFRNKMAVRISLATATLAFVVFMFPAPAPVKLVLMFVVFIAAGYMAVWAYVRRTGQPVSLGGGTRIGWMTGLFSFGIVAAVLVAGTIIEFPEMRQQLMTDPRIAEMMRLMDDRTVLIAMIISELFFTFVLFTLLPMAGGALCAKFLHKD